jgi:hypothetical protein
MQIGPTDFLERVEKTLEKKEETKRLLAQQVEADMLKSLSPKP